MSGRGWRVRAWVGLAGIGALAAACSVRTHSGADQQAGELACEESNECPTPDGACLTSMCLDGQCVYVPAPQGTLPPQDQREGDCQKLYCDGNGRVESFASAADRPPEDNNRCTESACQDGAPAQLPRPAGAVCGEEQICTGTGHCGVCLPDNQRCDGHTVAACDERGRWQPKQACGGQQPVCREARCTGVAQLVAGAGHACARFDDDSVRCWGRDQVGWSQSAAAQTSWAAGYVQVAAGAGHACALTADGAVWCWGRNDYGQLGEGSFDAHDGPVRLALPPAQELALGLEHSCALLRDGSVWCWGRGDRGQLALAITSKGPAPMAVLPAAGRDVAAPMLHATLLAGGHIAAPAGDLCVRQQARLMCVGGVPVYASADFPPAAQPDDDSERVKAIEARKKVARATASKLAGVVGAVELGCGDHHCCARLTAGTVHCWGAGDKGQLGAIGPDRANVAAVADVADARQMVVGGDFVCVAHSDGGVSCWGDNSVGQLGRSQAAGAVPARLSGVSAVSQLVAGRNFACALSNLGAVHCWGERTPGTRFAAVGASAAPAAMAW